MTLSPVIYFVKLGVSVYVGCDVNYRHFVIPFLLAIQRHWHAGCKLNTRLDIVKMGEDTDVVRLHACWLAFNKYMRPSLKHNAILFLNVSDFFAQSQCLLPEVLDCTRRTQGQ